MNNSPRVMMKQTFLLILALAALVRGQRPFFAGTKPIGYPVVTTTEGLADRFGEVDGTTQRLPIEANGDRELIDRLSKLPIDKQPFWFINWQALEAHRQNPQTYPQKPNPFIDPPQNTGSNTGNLGNSANFGIANSVNTGNTGSSLGNRNSGSVANSNPANLNSGSAASVPSSNTPSLANRNSFSASSTSKSTNGNAAVLNSASAVELAQRYGGIELNRYYENENDNTNLGSGTSNNKQGHNVNGN